MTIDAHAVTAHVDKTWDDEIVPVLHDYIRIPNVSVAYDAGWAETGHMARATELLRQWSESHAAGWAGATVEVQEIPGRTPLLVIDVPPAGGGRADDTVLLYGHLDKQPPFSGWRDGLGPWEPVVEGDRLYGRGGADDGYATFAALTAIDAVRAAGGSHSRCLVLIEASEESGSPDLPAHLDALGDRLGTPSLVVALDSWCGDWDRLWTTTSLRGLLDMVVEVRVLDEGIHSGSAGGVVPSSFRVLRQLLSRIEDERTGALLPRELHADVPTERLRQIAATAPDLDGFIAGFPFHGDTHPVRPSTEQLLVARTWEPALEVVGIGGAPTPERAGNVLRPTTRVKLSVRVPPTADAAAAADAVEAPAHRRSALRRHRDRDPGRGRARLARPAGGPLARPRPGPRLARRLRAAAPGAGRGGHDPVPRHARRPLPRGPVRGHRRAGTGVQRARAERVPPPADGT